MGEYSFSWTGTSRPVDLPSSLQKFDLEVRLGHPRGRDPQCRRKAYRGWVHFGRDTDLPGHWLQSPIPSHASEDELRRDALPGRPFGGTQPARRGGRHGQCCLQSVAAHSREADQDVENQPVVVSGGTGTVMHRVDVINGEET